MFDGSADAIGEGFADQYENDVDRDQFHVAMPRSIPRALSIRQMRLREEAIGLLKVV